MLFWPNAPRLPIKRVKIAKTANSFAKETGKAGNKRTPTKAIASLGAVEIQVIQAAGKCSITSGFQG